MYIVFDNKSDFLPYVLVPLVVVLCLAHIHLRGKGDVSLRYNLHTFCACVQSRILSLSVEHVREKCFFAANLRPDGIAHSLSCARREYRDMIRQIFSHVSRERETSLGNGAVPTASSGEERRRWKKVSHAWEIRLLGRGKRRTVSRRVIVLGSGRVHYYFNMHPS